MRLVGPERTLTVRAWTIQLECNPSWGAMRKGSEVLLAYARSGSIPLEVPRSELRRTEKLNSRDRQMSLTGYVLARQLLLDAGLGVHELRRRCSNCGSGAHGALVSPHSTISVSHASDHVVVAVDPLSRPLGVDIETVERAHEIRAVWSQVSLSEVPADTLSVVAHWTRLEATSKALSRGLAMDFRSIRMPAVGQIRAEGQDFRDTALTGLPSGIVGSAVLGMTGRCEDDAAVPLRGQVRQIVLRQPSWPGPSRHPGAEM